MNDKIIPIHTNASFECETVPLDDIDLKVCTFINCTLVYKGERSLEGTAYALKGDTFVELQGAAKRAGQFLRTIGAIKNEFEILGGATIRIR